MQMVVMTNGRGKGKTRRWWPSWQHEGGVAEKLPKERGLEAGIATHESKKKTTMTRKLRGNSGRNVPKLLPRRCASGISGVPRRSAHKATVWPGPQYGGPGRRLHVPGAVRHRHAHHHRHPGHGGGRQDRAALRLFIFGSLSCFSFPLSADCYLCLSNCSV